MSEDNISQEFRLKNIDKTRNYLNKEINRNKLMSKEHKKVFLTQNYIEHFFISGSTVTGCILISAFTSLISILVGIMSCAIGLKICVVAAGIKKHKSIIKKNKKKHNKIVLLPNSKWNNMEVLISKALIDSNNSHDEFALIHNVLKEYEELKEEIQNVKA